MPRAGALSGTGAGFVLTSEPAPLRNLLADLVRSRQLVNVLARRSFFIRYRRASFGLAWAVGLPLTQAIVMAAIFHYAVRINTPHYPVFVFTGLFAWSFFSNGVLTGTTSIVDNSSMSSRIYFPRAVLPIVSVLAEVYAFAISVVILLGLAAAFQVWPGWHTLWLAPAAALLVLLTVGAATVLSALQVYFRDVRYVVQASLLAWFYLTPVFYPLEFLREHRVPAALRVVVQVNPATGVVELFRAAVTGADRGWGAEALITTAWAVALLALGTWLHRRWDRLFADLL